MKPTYGRQPGTVMKHTKSTHNTMTFLNPDQHIRSCTMALFKQESRVIKLDFTCHILHLILALVTFLYLIKLDSRLYIAFNLHGYIIELLMHVTFNFFSCHLHTFHTPHFFVHSTVHISFVW